MTANTNQNLHTPSQNTEVVSGYLLKITSMKIRENGIEYFFQPLGKTVTIASLENITKKDLIFSQAYIRHSQKSILLPTNMIAPRVYKNLLKREESQLEQLYKEGDYLAEVIQIHN